MQIDFSFKFMKISFSYENEHIAQIGLLSHHGPEVVCHFLSIQQDSPKKEISPRVLATSVQVLEVFLAVSSFTCARLK